MKGCMSKRRSGKEKKGRTARGKGAGKGAGAVHLFITRPAANADPVTAEMFPSFLRSSGAARGIEAYYGPELDGPRKQAEQRGGERCRLEVGDR